MSEFTPIETQEQFDRAIGERLTREKEKYKDYMSPEEVKEKYSGYLSPEDVEEKYRGYMSPEDVEKKYAGYISAVRVALGKNANRKRNWIILRCSRFFTGRNRRGVEKECRSIKKDS